MTAAMNGSVELEKQTQRIVTESSKTGTVTHSLENYITGQPRPTGGNMVYSRSKKVK